MQYYVQSWQVVLGALVLIHGFEFHLREFQGVVVAFPGEPVDTVSERFVDAVIVVTVQIGMMTVTIPPASFELLCTRGTIDVVVLVFGAEFVSDMIGHRITFKQQQIHMLNCMHVKKCEALCEGGWAKD